MDKDAGSNKKPTDAATKSDEATTASEASVLKAPGSNGVAAPPTTADGVKPAAADDVAAPPHLQRTPSQLRKPTAEDVDTPEFLAAMRRFVQNTLAKDLVVIEAEFKRLQEMPRPQPTPEFTRNLALNRYRDIVCVNQNRVKLNGGRYIHANWIDYLGSRRIICTQGPLPTTCEDFWMMVVQEGIEAIVMLCDCVELNQIKCHQYWPTRANPVLTFGQFELKFLQEMQLDTLNKTYVAVNGGGKKLQVRHFHWRQWPDRGVPPNHLAPLRLVHYLKPYQRIIMHCSAGIGRTGTVTAIFLAEQRLRAGLDLDVFELVRELRQQRARSVQSIDQYLYIYSVLFRYARNKTGEDAPQKEREAAERLLKVVVERMKCCC